MYLIKNPEQIFTEAYEKNICGGKKGGVFYSGAGTPNTMIYFYNLATFIKEHHIQKILDIGYRDLTIVKQVTEQIKMDYTCGDVVEDLILHYQVKFQNDNTRFIHLNANDELADANLVTISQVLLHISNEQIPVTDNAEYNLDKIAGPHIEISGRR